MLKEKFNKNDVVSVKLISGEEIITKLSSSTSEVDDAYQFSKPYSLSPTPQGMAMVPFIMTGDNDKYVISVHKNKVICILKTNKNIEQEYIKMTTGIMTPNPIVQ